MFYSSHKGFEPTTYNISKIVLDILKSSISIVFSEMFKLTKLLQFAGTYLLNLDVVKLLSKIIREGTSLNKGLVVMH